MSSKEKAALSLAQKNALQLVDIIQQVKSIKVVTQTQYDAISSSKTSDNCLYLIRG